MNKIKISNEQERIKVEFDFENIEVARQYFTDEECIKYIVEALDYEGEEEAQTKEDPKVEGIKNSLRELFGKAPIGVLNGFKEMIDEELSKRG